MKATGLVINLRAGGGRARRRWERIHALVIKQLSPVALEFTSAAGQGFDLARTMIRSGVELLVAAGGDGTVHEVANAILQEATPPTAVLGVLPLGSASDFARSAGIPRNPEAAVEALAQRTVVPIDVAEISSSASGRRFFLNVASCGLGAAVARRLQAGRSRSSGAWRYLRAVIAELSRQKPPVVTIARDGVTAAVHGAVTHVAAGNGRFQAAGMEICPNAKLDDGWLEVTVIRPVGVAELLCGARLLYRGQIYRHPKVEYYRAQRLRLESSDPVEVETDGEPFGRMPVDINVHPRALRLVVPPPGRPAAA
jgi:YegS/Rv2252/BmrU family lipid kinase